ncbi:Protein kinase domain/Protein tyrosine kinase [Novymonas esmeraldas]|uniref:Protein kinase domain/Protein tyrosine kinase n=1 Tax=Novymonas esmeraldas TaxID=1808958 RepID=A0AAW0F1Z6_9TRYP
MLRGDYAGALAAYRGVADIADLEPGLLPAGMRREAAASAVTGGAASVQVARLVRECEQRVRHRVVEPLCRVRACPLGVDAVLGDAARVERVDDGAEAALPAEPQCPERRASSPRTRADVRAAAQQEGRYGASGSAALVTRTATRHVAIIDGTQTRTAHTGSPESLTDNWGVTWRVATKLRADKGREGHSSHYVGMGLSGGLCSIRYRLFRDVPPMVSAALKDTAPGRMSDAMRSAVPLIAASAEQRTAVHALFGPFVNGLRHPHIVACLGYCVTLEGGVAVLSEYCSGGSLREMLHQYGRVVKPATIGRFAICILRGLQFLHSNGLVHGSVRPENVLVCADGRCRLKGYWTDHALAHRVLSIPRTCYVSPEMAAGLSPTPASDVFCYGLTVVELATGQLPWVWAPVVGEGPQRSPESLTQVARAGGQVFYDLVAQRCVTTAVSHLQAAVDADHPVQGALIAKACLAWNPVDRPSVAGVRRRVEQLAEAYAVCVPE